MTKTVEKIWRMQERLIRQSNKAWARGVRAEYRRHQDSVSMRHHKKAARLVARARAAHKTLVAVCPEFWWAQP